MSKTNNKKYLFEIEIGNKKENKILFILINFFMAIPGRKISINFIQTKEKI